MAAAPASRGLALRLVAVARVTVTVSMLALPGAGHAAATSPIDIDIDTDTDTDAATRPATARSSPVLVWPGLRARLFGERPIETGAAVVVALEAPERATDGASVPVAIRAQQRPADDASIRRLWLIVDRNPSPVAAVFRFGPGSGGADIETRLRVEQYSDVRAIAEFDDGRLQMASRYVKASGGCSAPAGRDAAEVQASLGKARLTVFEPARPGQPAQAVLRLRHPNASGMARDPLTQLYAPARYLRRLEVFAGREAVLEADLDISISEDPHFRFAVAEGATALRATLTDTDAQVFEVRADAADGSP